MVLGQLACASSPGGTDPAAGAEPVAAGPAMCVTVEIQHQSVRGVTVWVEWENSAPRRLDRLSINDRDVYQLPFRNAQLNLRFQQEGASQVEHTNPVLPTPGDRIEIVYRQSGPGPLRRIGPARCR